MIALLLILGTWVGARGVLLGMDADETVLPLRAVHQIDLMTQLRRTDRLARPVARARVARASGVFVVRGRNSAIHAGRRHPSTTLPDRNDPTVLPADGSVFFLPITAASEGRTDQSAPHDATLMAPLGRGLAPYTPRRWSADGWVMVRQRADPPLLSAGAGAYGGSQWGAVVRYALSPESPHRPATYLRVATAMRSGRDRQAALGLSARPLPRLPVALLTELRVQQGEGRAQLRPAVALVGGMTQRLPMNLEADGYGQAGWVGGTFATAFFDGQATVDHRIAPVDGGTTFRNGQLRLGGAVWSGGQRGATRLDVGPRLTLRGQLGETNARLALDWRFRIAGRAEPGSGPVLTLAAGF